VTSAPAGYRPALDGLRAVAVLLVVLFHSGVGVVANGYVGVDVFFVLSGYLVTSVILAEHQSTGRLELRRFYARRVRRLLPASLVVITVTSLVTPLIVPRLQRAAFVGDARAALLYVANWHFAGASTDYFAHDVSRSPFLHMWSLAVEEQFYAVYPAVLLAAMWIVRRRWPHRTRAAVGAVLGLVGVLSLVRLAMLSDSNPVAAYYATDARLYQLVGGAVLALGVRRWTGWTHRWPLATSRLGIVALVALVGLATSLVDLGSAARGLFVVAATLALLMAAEGAQTHGVSTLLTVRPLVWVGTLSYAVYLWHWPVIVLVDEVGEPSPWVMVAVATSASLVLAVISGRILEQPIRRSVRWNGRPLTVVAGGLAIGLVVAVVVPPVLASHRRPATWAREPASIVEIPAVEGVDPARVAAVLAEAVPTDDAIEQAIATMPDHDEFSCRPSEPETCVVVPEGDFSILLLGDSNALMLLPVLREVAERDGIRLASMTRPGCPWQQGLTWQTDSQPLIDQCTAARQQAYDTLLPWFAPDVVVLVEVPRDPGSRADTFWSQEPGEVATATAASLDLLTAGDARALMVEPLPYSMDEPTICLSAAQTAGECAFEANTEPFPTERVMRSEAERRDDVWTVDLDLLGCPLRPVCAAAIDGEVVFRDRYHLTEAWLRERVDVVWATMVATGAFEGWFDPA
jgi:peptidoglycan/LPS O-acetylase OafA/YrhL